MDTDKFKCVGCGNCVPVCTMGAIHIENAKSTINQEECVECGTCKRFLRVEGYPPIVVRAVRKALGVAHLGWVSDLDVCPSGALYQPELEWPRSIRQVFSDPLIKHPGTDIGGRGTEEIKTNDVTNRLQEGDAGVIVELGRPGVGARFRDLQTMAMAMAEAGVEFEKNNPVTALMSDSAKGIIKKDILDEKVLSAIIESKVKLADVPKVLAAIQEAQKNIKTVCSVAVAARCGADGTAPYHDMLREHGYWFSLNGKTNLGLGRATTKGVTE